MSLFFDWFFSQYKDVPRNYIILEIIGVIFGLMSVLFSKKRNILVYPTGIISTLIFVYLLWAAQLFGDMLINGYYTIMSVYGWVVWTRHSEDKIHTKISKTTSSDRIFILILAMFSWLFVMMVYWLKPFIKNNFSCEGVSAGFQHFTLIDYTDIFTTSVAVMGMWLMAQRKIENWICWIVVDVVSVPLYYYKGLIFSSFQFFVFTIIAILAYFEWRKIYDSEKQSVIG